MDDFFAMISWSFLDGVAIWVPRMWCDTSKCPWENLNAALSFRALCKKSPSLKYRKKSHSHSVGSYCYFFLLFSGNLITSTRTRTMYLTQKRSTESLLTCLIMSHVSTASCCHVNRMVKKGSRSASGMLASHLQQVSGRDGWREA